MKIAFSPKALIVLLFSLLIHLKAIAQAPVIDNFNPSSSAAGSTVTITGNHFGANISANFVSFGKVPATILSATETKITVKVPATGGYNNINVLNLTSGLQKSSSSFFDVTFPIKDKITASNFEVTTTLIMDGQLSNAVAGDLDGDGKLDLVTNKLNSNSILIYRNIENTQNLNKNSFADKFELTTTTAPSKVLVEDMDGDGKPDIIVNTGYNALMIFKNISTNGSVLNNSSFKRIDLSFEVADWALAVADIDNDGKPDIVTADTQGNLLILKNDAVKGNITSTSFTLKASISQGAHSGDIVLADFDGDQKTDIAIDDHQSDILTVFHNQVNNNVINNSSFTEINIPSAGNSGGMVAADINGDNKPELIISKQNDNSIYIFKNEAITGSLTSSSFVLKDKIYSGKGATTVQSGDMDGDGKPDILVTNETEKTLCIFKNIYDKTNDSGNWLDKKIKSDLGIRSVGLSLADLNNDGKADLFFPNAVGSLTIIKNEPVAIPAINSFSPFMANAGTIITLTGKNFTNDASNVQVYFGDRAAELVKLSDTEIQVKVPNGATFCHIGVLIKI